MRFNRARGDLDHDQKGRRSFLEMRTAARVAGAHELRPGSFVRHLGLVLPGMADLPGDRHGSYGVDRMVATTSAYSNRGADIDLSQPDCIVYICSMAGIFWIVTRLPYGA